MRHQRRPAACWCGDKHTASEAFSLNLDYLTGDQSAPSDENTEIEREYEAQEDARDS